MSAEYFYDVGLLVDDDTFQPRPNRNGKFISADGTALAIYDMIGTPVLSLRTNHIGYIARFRADVPSGYVKFGSVVVPVTATNLGQRIPSFALTTASVRPVVPEGTRLVIIAAPGGQGLGPQVPSWALPGDVVIPGLVVGGSLAPPAQ